MNVGLITSLRGKKSYGQHYEKIVEHLTKRGFHVQHLLHLDLQEYDQKPLISYEKELSKHLKKLKNCDFIIAECSEPSINVGYGVAFMLQLGKPMIILYKKGSEGFEFGIAGLLVPSQEAMSIHEYEEDSLVNVLEYAIGLIQQHVDRRFTIIFPPTLMSRLQEVSQKKKLPKSVYIRELIEKELEKETVSPKRA